MFFFFLFFLLYVSHLTFYVFALIVPSCLVFPPTFCLPRWNKCACGIPGNFFSNVSWQGSCIHRLVLIIQTAGSCPSLCSPLIHPPHTPTHTSQEVHLCVYFLFYYGDKVLLMFPPWWPSVLPPHTLTHSLNSRTSKRLKRQMPQIIIGDRGDKQVMVDDFESVCRKLDHLIGPSICPAFPHTAAVNNHTHKWVSTESRNSWDERGRETAVGIKGLIREGASVMSDH